MLNFFSSMKVGLALIALLAISSVFATLEPQSTIYSSFWFRGILLLLSLNLLICTVRRLPSLVKRFNKTIAEEDLEKVKYKNGQKINNLPEWVQYLDGFFKEKGYRVNKVAANNKQLIFANKGKLDLLAPHLVHISMLIIVLGALIGSLGAKDYIKSSIGETVWMPKKIIQGVQIKLDDFRTLYDKNNNIDNWESKFTLMENGNVLVKGVTKVNKPFKYEGIKFYQSGYGYTHNVEVQMGTQEKEMSFNHNKPVTLTKNIYIMFTKKGKDFFLEKYQNNMLVETLELNNGLEFYPLDEFKMTYLSSTPYSVLKAKIDPGLPIVMFGFILMSVGFLLSWLSRYQEIKVFVDYDKSLANINVYCKSKQTQDDIKRQLANLLSGGN